MKGTAPVRDSFDVGRTDRESEEEIQELYESNCGAKEVSQRLLEKKHIGRREDPKSEIEPDIIAPNTLAPIKRLSHDVLCHIFELHCKGDLPVAFPMNWGPASLEPPQTILSHVCSTWREIMLDVPTFWRCIEIIPSGMDLLVPQALRLVVRKANTWLSRAKGLPCSIDIDFPDDDHFGARRRSLWRTDWHENIIRDLISLHKFKRLGVTFADRHLRELPDDKLSCIEDLSLRYISPNEDDTASPLDSHKLSNLTSFSLLRNPFDFYSLSDPVEGYSKFSGILWHNLRHIDLRATIPAPFCLDALKHCSAVLETCALVITGDHTFTSSPQVPVHLSQLRELKVIVCSRSREEEILELFLLSFRFPRLKSLTLGSVDYPPILINLQMLLRVQDASQMHLEELIIFDTTLSVDVCTLLMHFPSLRRLELPNPVTFTDEAIIEVGAGSIGVFLEDLTINNSGLDLKKMLQMIKARSPAGDRDSKHQIEVTEFKSVTFRCDKEEDEVGDEVLAFMEEIKLMDVDLNVIFAEYSDEESEELEQGDLNDDYVDFSDESYDEESIYGDFNIW